MKTEYCFCSVMESPQMATASLSWRASTAAGAGVGAVSELGRRRELEREPVPPVLEVALRAPARRERERASLAQVARRAAVVRMTGERGWSEGSRRRRVHGAWRTSFKWGACNEIIVDCAVS